MDTDMIIKIALAVSTAAFSISEYLGSTQKFKSNSVLQAIGTGAKLLMGILSGASAVKKGSKK